MSRAAGRSALTSGWARLARAGVLGGASLFLAAAAHALGGGSLPGGGMLTLTGVGLGLVAVSLTARRLRFGVLLAVLAVEQALLHVLLHAATATTGCASVIMPGHAMGAAVCSTGSISSYGWLMLVGHALAVATTAWLLARGEALLWASVERLHGYATVHPSLRVRRPRPLAAAARVLEPAGAAWRPAAPRAPPVV